MKSRIITVLVLSIITIGQCYGQHYIGIRGGGGGGNVRFKPNQETALHMITPLAGISYKYYGGDKFFGGIEIDLSVQQKGYKVLPRPKSDSSYIRTITSIELPFLWQPHIDMFKKRARFFLNAGPYVSYNLSSREKFITKEDGEIYNREYKFNNEKDNRMEYGLTFGAGYGVTIAKRIDVQAEFRYNFGLSNILKSHTKYPSNPSESPMDFLSVSIGVYYKFGKDK